MSAWQLFSLEPPAKWRAGFTGTDANSPPFYFDCAGCGAKEPEIAGVIGTGPTLEDIGVIPRDGLYKTAMFCALCFEKLQAQAKDPQQEVAA